MRNQRILGIVLSYIFIVLNTIISLIYVPLLIHFLGQNEYGLYQMMGSFIAYFSVMDFGLSNTIVRFYSKYKTEKKFDRMENVLYWSRIIYIFLSLVMLLIGAIIYPLLDTVYNSSLTSQELMETKVIFVVLLINIIITLMTNVDNAVITAEQKFVFLKLLQIIQALIQPLLIVSLLFSWPYALTVVLVQTSLNLIFSLIRVYFNKKVLKTKIVNHGYNKKFIKKLITFSAAIFIVAITDQLFWKTNQLILGAIVGTTAVAIYSVASQIYMNYVTLSSVIQGVFLPKVTAMVVNNDDVNSLFIRIGRIQYILLACVLGGFIVYGKEFISLWVGEGYQESYYITLIIISAMTIDLIQSIGGTIMQAKNIYLVRAKVLITMAIFNVILAIFLGNLYGPIGCAIATSICMIIGNGFVMNYIYKVKMKLDIFLFWKEIIKITVPAIITLFIGIILKQIIYVYSFFTLGTNVFLYLLVYTILVLFLGLDKNERKMVCNKFMRFRRD